MMVVLVVAAFSDIRERRIPNWTVGLVATLGFICAAADGGLVGAGWAMSAGLAVLMIGFGLFAIGWIGAGDAKLFGAVAIYSGWNSLGPLTLMTVVAGGALAVIALAQRPADALAVLRQQPRKTPATQIPYGVAIALGGIAVASLRLAY